MSMSKIVGLISIKGGVGKTTIAASLASDLVNHYGKKVLLIDANYSAPNIGLHMDIVEPDKSVHDVLEGKSRISSAIHKRYGVDVVPGKYIYNERINPLKLKDRIRGIEKNYDFVIIDSSPSLNEEVLSTILASNVLFVVTTPDYPTLSCSMIAAKVAKQRGRPIAGIIMNKIREPVYELTLNEIESSTGIPVVAKIPDDKINVRALFSRIPTSVYNRYSKFSKEISRLSAALAGEDEKRGFFRKFLPKNFFREEANRKALKESFYTKTF